MEVNNLKYRKSKVITISLPEALEWKLSQVSKASGVPKSTLISRALLLLISDFLAVNFPGGDAGQGHRLSDLEKEYAEREVSDGKTS